MNMLAFDPIRAMGHDLLIVFNILQHLLNCIKKSEAVARLARGGREAGDRQEENNIRIRN